MWDCLVKLSTWAEGNSGQIQIVVAVAALFFAYKAYLGLMIQLKHSNEQENVANEQRYFVHQQPVGVILSGLWHPYPPHSELYPNINPFFRAYLTLDRQ